MEEQCIRTGIIISVVVDGLEVTVVAAATLPHRARATTPKATQVALRCRVFRLEVAMVVYYLLARRAHHKNDSLEAFEIGPSPSAALTTNHVKRQVRKGHYTT